MPAVAAGISPVSTAPCTLLTCVQGERGQQAEPDADRGGDDEQPAQCFSRRQQPLALGGEYGGAQRRGRDGAADADARSG